MDSNSLWTHTRWRASYKRAATPFASDEKYCKSIGTDWCSQVGGIISVIVIQRGQLLFWCIFCICEVKVPRILFSHFTSDRCSGPHACCSGIFVLTIYQTGLRPFSALRLCLVSITSSIYRQPWCENKEKISFGFGIFHHKWDEMISRPINDFSGSWSWVRLAGKNQLCIQTCFCLMLVLINVKWMCNECDWSSYRPMSRLML